MVSVETSGQEECLFEVLQWVFAEACMPICSLMCFCVWVPKQRDSQCAVSTLGDRKMIFVPNISSKAREATDP